MIIGYAALEIWCVTDVIVIFHLGLLFVLLPPNNLKNENLKKIKKKKKKKKPWRYHHFTQLYQKS